MTNTRTISKHLLSLEPQESAPFLALLEQAACASMPVDELRAQVLVLLEPFLFDSTYPAWLVFQAGIDHRFAISSVLHLGGPLFWADYVDGDSFFSHFHGIEKGQLIYRGGSTETFEYTGKRETKVRKRRTEKDLARVGAYDHDGTCVITHLCWFEPRPSTNAGFLALMEEATEALAVEMALYEASAEEDSKTSEVAESSTSSEGGDSTVPRIWCFGVEQGRSNASEEEGPREKPEVLWSTEADGISGSDSGGDPVVGDGFVFASTSSYTMSSAAVRLDGSTRWSREITTSQGWPIGNACIVEGSIYMGSNKGIHALDAETGEERWLSKVSGLQHSAPVVVNGLCYALGKGAVSAIKLDTGRKAWSFKFEGKFCEGLSYKEGVLFFAGGGKAMALEANKNKRVVWEAPCSKFIAGHRGVLVYEDLVIVESSRSGHLQALDRKDGSLRWESAFCGASGYRLGNGPCAASKGVFVGKDGDGCLRALNLADGSTRWVYKVQEFKQPYMIGKGGVTIAGGTVYAVLVEDGGASRRELVAVDLLTGGELWRLGRMEYFVGEEKTPYDQQTFSWNCTPAVHQGVLYAQICNQLFALG